MEQRPPADGIRRPEGRCRAGFGRLQPGLNPKGAAGQASGGCGRGSIRRVLPGRKMQRAPYPGSGNRRGGFRRCGRPENEDVAGRDPQDAAGMRNFSRSGIEKKF